MSAIDTNVAICKALGLDPKNVEAINIKIRPSAYPRVFVKYGQGFLHGEENLSTAFKVFRLVE